VIGRILQIILPVFAIVGVGWLYGRKVTADVGAAVRMNMDVFVPALILSALTSRDFGLGAHRGLVLGAAAVIAGSGLVAWPASRLLRVEARTFVPPMMFNNSGNMGLPLALLAFGERNLPAAVAMFLTSNVLHFTVGTSIVRRDAHFLHFLLNPMIVATAAGLGLKAAGVSFPAWMAVTLKMLGDVCLPLMLFTLGVRMAATATSGWRVAAAGAVLRPLSGLAIALPLGPLLGLPPLQQGMLVLFASLPPAVFNFLIAEQYRQEPERVATIVLAGHLASLGFVPLGLWLALRGS